MGRHWLIVISWCGIWIQRYAKLLTLNACVVEEWKLLLQVDDEALLMFTVLENELLPQLDLLLLRVLHRLQPAQKQTNPQPHSWNIHNSFTKLISLLSISKCSSDQLLILSQLLIQKPSGFTIFSALTQHLSIDSFNTNLTCHSTFEVLQLWNAVAICNPLLEGIDEMM